MDVFCDEVVDFYEEEIPKVDSNHTCIALLKKDEDEKSQER